MGIIVRVPENSPLIGNLLTSDGPQQPLELIALVDPDRLSASIRATQQAGETLVRCARQADTVNLDAEESFNCMLGYVAPPAYLQEGRESVEATELAKSTTREVAKDLYPHIELAASTEKMRANYARRFRMLAASCLAVSMAGFFGSGAYLVAEDQNSIRTGKQYYADEGLSHHQEAGVLVVTAAALSAGGVAGWRASRGLGEESARRRAIKEMQNRQTSES